LLFSDAQTAPVLCVSVCDISEPEVLLNPVSALNADELNPICKEKEKNQTIMKLFEERKTYPQT
jgi:hypothetical protein